MRSLSCVCVSVYPPYQILNARTNLYETWYVYHTRNKEKLLDTSFSMRSVSHKTRVCGSVCAPPLKHTSTRKVSLGTFKTGEIKSFLSRLLKYTITTTHPFLSLSVPISLQDNVSVHTFLRQRRIVGDVLFYAVRVVSKKVGD
jgi:hypothetical protein